MERSYRLSDIVKDDFLRFPMTLLANPKYREISLEAKFIYSLLLNRLTLSQTHGWVNEEKEVYLIYTREEAANVLNISYRKAIAAFRELIEVGLLFEQRQGRGQPNLLYVLKAELNDDDAEEFIEQMNTTDYEEEQEEIPDLPPIIPEKSEPIKIENQDMQNLHIKTCKNCSSRHAEIAYQDMQKLHPRKTDNRKIDNIYNNISQSIYNNNSGIEKFSNQSERIYDGRTDDDSDFLENIYDKCELDIFQPNIKVMFKTVIERLYYSNTLKIGNAILPKEKVRSYLTLLDFDILMGVLENMKRNKERINNPTAYMMSVIFNAICEKDSNLILSLPPEYLDTEDFYAPAGGEQNSC